MRGEEPVKEEDVAALEDEIALRAKRHHADMKSHDADMKSRGADAKSRGADAKPRLFVDPGVPRLPNAAWARLGMPPPGPELI